MYIFAKFIHHKGYDAQKLNIKYIISAGEVLYEWVEEELGNIFGCPIIEFYGANELGPIAYRFPCGHLHVMDDYIYVEVNRISPTEDYGELVVTRLDNWEFPMIRYKLEDFVVPSEEDSTCSLGIGLSRFEQIIGRQFDSFRISDGRMIQGSTYNYFIKNIDGVRQYQVIQKQPDVI